MLSSMVFVAENGITEVEMVCMSIDDVVLNGFVAENGITEVEMEDMLSLDDDVLNDVYVYWTPPIRRLPPLLWVRVRNDLDEYLVDR